MSYELNDPRGWCGDPRRGASLGRRDRLPENPAEWEGVLALAPVRLDAGGYDRLGTYWGRGVPLYWASNEDGSVELVVRATGARAAREQVLARLPRAKFKRRMRARA